jgi:hypothetical protein
MCQLNSYFVPHTLRENEVLEIMRTAGMECCESMDDYQGMREFKGYNAFFSAPMRCNCGSLISKLQESDCASFAEYKAASVKEEVTRLERIRDFMTADGYAERRAAFEAGRERLSDNTQMLIADIGEKERELTDAVMLRTDISDEEKSRLMHETVYPVVHKLIEESQHSPEAIAANAAYQNFLAENRSMWDSWCYTLEKTEPQAQTAVPLTLQKAIEFGGYTPEPNGESETDADDTETYTITMPSNNILDVIEAAKSKDYSDWQAEFDAIKRFVAAVTERTGKIRLFAYWQTDACKIIGKRKISMKDFNIDSLLFLPYLTILEIERGHDDVQK